MLQINKKVMDGGFLKLKGSPLTSLKQVHIFNIMLMSREHTFGASSNCPGFLFAIGRQEHIINPNLHDLH